MQYSNLREVRRLTNLLLKIKRYERQREGVIILRQSRRSCEKIPERAKTSCAEAQRRRGRKENKVVI
jgi:hypothetical protein